jgi:N-methylhydantoinase A
MAAVLSAWGMLATDLRYELVRSHVSDVRRLTAPALRRLFAVLEADGRRRLGRFDGAVDVHRSVDMRYGEQIFEIQVPLDGVDLAAADVLDAIAARFHRRHEELYAYSAPGQEVVIVNARVGWREVPVYRLDGLPAGYQVDGPAVFESATTTVLLREGEQAEITARGWLEIRLPAS